MSAAMLAEHEFRVRDANVFRSHDLVGAALFQHAVLMDAGFVGESVLADDRLVPLHLHAGDGAEFPAGRRQQTGVDAGLELVEIAPCFQGHDDFFEGAVSRALTDAVDRAFNLSGSFHERRETVRHRQPEIVVAVNAVDDFVRSADVLLQIADDLGIVRWDGVADGVGNVQRRRAGLDRLLDDFGQEIEFGASGVFGGEFHVFDVAASALNAFMKIILNFEFYIIVVRLNYCNYELQRFTELCYSIKIVCFKIMGSTPVFITVKN